MFAVIAAIIIVAPISFYEFSSHSSGISVKSSNTVTNLTFAVNFTKYTDTSTQFNPNYENFSSVTMIDPNGSNSSTLEIKGYIFEYFAASRGYYTLGLNFSVTGNISSSIPPSGLLLTFEGSNYSKDNLFVNQLGDGIINNINSTDHDSVNTCYGPFENHTSVQLIEVRNVTTQYRYHFVFSDGLGIDIHPYYIHPAPFNVSIQASLSGYSSQVLDQLNFHVEDVS
jgi:hypothetical protein